MKRVQTSRKHAGYPDELEYIEFWVVEIQLVVERRSFTLLTNRATRPSHLDQAINWIYRPRPLGVDQNEVKHQQSVNEVTPFQNYGECFICWKKLGHQCITVILTNRL